MSTYSDASKMQNQIDFKDIVTICISMLLLIRVYFNHHFFGKTFEKLAEIVVRNKGHLCIGNRHLMWR